MRCEVGHNYSSIRNGQRYVYREGDVVEVDDADVEWINVDSPGTLKVLDGDAPEPEPAPEPQSGAAVLADATHGVLGADAGEAVNAETGEVTAPGEPLPPLEPAPADPPAPEPAPEPEADGGKRRGLRRK